MIEVEVRGRFLNPDGNPLKGTVSFTPRSAGASPLENLLFPAVTVQVRLDNDGRFRVTLRATDDPDTAPVDWTYRVAEQIGPSSTWRTYDIEVPSASEVAGIELADVAPVDPAFGSVTIYALASAVTAVADDLADLAASLGTAATEDTSAFDPAGAAASAQAAAVAAAASDATTKADAAAAASAPRGAFTKTDSAAGLIDWINNSATGYLAHLRTGASSTSGAAAIGIGTDQGTGSGLLISHKNSGYGINLGVQPGAGIGALFTGRSSAAPLHVATHPGGGAVTVQANTGANYADGVTTASSTTFTSATAAFVVGDVGATLTQLTSRGLNDPSNAIPPGTTIAAYVSPTQVTLSQPAGASGTGILFGVGGRVMPVAQSMFRVLNESSTELAAFTKGGLTLQGGAAAETTLKVTGTAGQTANIFAALLSGNATPALNIAANGGVVAPFGTFLSNAGNVNTPALISTAWSSNAAIRVTRSATDKTGDLLVACEASSTTPLTRINKEGFFMTRKAAAPPDADIATGEMALWFDATAGAAKLMIKAKNASGTVVTGQVALA